MNGVKFINEFIRAFIENYPRFRVSRWVYGDKYLAIENENYGLGFAHVDSIVKMVWRDPDNILDRLDEVDPNDLTYLIQHPNPAYKYVGHAYINSIVNSRDLVELDIGDPLDKIPSNGGTAIVVGFIAPIVRKLKELRYRVYAIEASLDTIPSDIRYRDEIYPWWSYEDLVIDADILVLSGSTISNNTIGYLLDKARHVPMKMILGPSTTLLIKLFKKYRVRFLGSSISLDNDKVFKIVKEGYGYHTLKNMGLIKSITIDLSHL